MAESFVPGASVVEMAKGGGQVLLAWLLGLLGMVVVTVVAATW